MYRETRPTDISTPESWAGVFGDVSKRPFWRVWRIRHTPEWKLIERYVPRGARVLDAGCGNGAWVEALFPRYEAEGCDFSEQMIAQLRKGFPDRRWMQSDIRAMSYEDGRFGAIISWGVIEHDPNGPAAALKEFHRVLAKDGVIVVTVPRDYDMQRRAAMLDGSDGNGVFYQFCMTPEELASFVREAGFKVLETGILPYANPFIAWPRFMRRLNGIPLRIVLLAFSFLRFFTKRYAAMIYCVAQVSS